MNRMKMLKALGDKFSDAELRTISKGGGLAIRSAPAVKISHTGKTLKIGFITDTHIGAEYFKSEYLDSAFKTFRKEGVDFVIHGGDVTEGMSVRPGQVYELTHVGYDEQKTYAIEQLSKWTGKMYLIDGNHDRWYLKANGALIVKDIARELPNAEFIGHDEGDIRIGNIWIKMFHGEDSSSYATSYRIQKLVESYTGGEKPNALFVGHTHKQGYFFERNIHCVSGGAISTQSRWMRSKRLANHTGYHTVEMIVNDGGIVEFKVAFHPFYA
jgi:predicted phosphodiesterase